MSLLRKIFGLKSKEEKAAIKAVAEKAYQEDKQQLAEKLVGLRRPSVCLERTDSKTNSKLGGQPLVEIEHFTWPISNGKPLAFLAQIALAEISAAYQYAWLPKNGMLLFFYDMHEMPWGFDPEDRDKWKVIYYAKPTQYASAPASLSNDSIVKEFYLQARREDILPYYEHASISELELNDEDSELFFDLRDGDEDDYAPKHQVGGFQTPIQNADMELDAQLASNGLYIGNAKAYHSEQGKLLAAGAKDWKLLLQIDSDEDFMWGDAGMLYFWVEEQRAKNKDFDNVWLISQCH